MGYIEKMAPPKRAFPTVNSSPKPVVEHKWTWSSASYTDTSYQCRWSAVNDCLLRRVAVNNSKTYKITIPCSVWKGLVQDTPNFLPRIKTLQVQFAAHGAEDLAEEEDLVHLPDDWVLRINLYREELYVGILKLDSNDPSQVLTGLGMNFLPEDFFQLLEKLQERSVMPNGNKRRRTAQPNRRKKDCAEKKQSLGFRKTLYTLTGKVRGGQTTFPLQTAYAPLSALTADMMRDRIDGLQARDLQLTTHTQHYEVGEPLLQAIYSHKLNQICYTLYNMELLDRQAQNPYEVAEEDLRHTQENEVLRNYRLTRPSTIIPSAQAVRLREAAAKEFHFTDLIDGLDRILLNIPPWECEAFKKEALQVCLNPALLHLIQTFKGDPKRNVHDLEPKYSMLVKHFCAKSSFVHPEAPPPETMDWTTDPRSAGPAAAAAAGAAVAATVPVEEAVAAAEEEEEEKEASALAAAAAEAEECEKEKNKLAEEEKLIQMDIENQAFIPTPPDWEDSQYPTPFTGKEYIYLL